MKNSLFILFGFLPMLLSAQYFEAGLFLGGSNYMGDLANNSNSLYIQETNLAGGAFVRYNVNDYVTARFGFNYARLSGDDVNADDLAINQRNLSFYSNVYEFGLTGEFNILGYQPYNYYRRFSPYLFAGVALFKFNPKTEFQGENVELQPLGTEGQGLDGRPDQYGLVQFAIPLGFGLKFALTENINVGLEIGARKTFTDYIDDVSTTYMDLETLQARNGELAAALSNREAEFLNTPVDVIPGEARGDEAGSDWYFIFGLTVSYNFFDNGLVGSRGTSGRGKRGCYD